MADCTPAQVRELGELAGDFLDPPFTDPILTRIILSAQPHIDDVCWDTDADQGLCLLSAHFAFKLAGGGASGGAGAVTAEAAGGLSRSYASVMAGANDYDLLSTPYGIQFVMLRDSLVCPIVPVILC